MDRLCLTFGSYTRSLSVELCVSHAFGAELPRNPIAPARALPQGLRLLASGEALAILHVSPITTNATPKQNSTKPHIATDASHFLVGSASSHTSLSTSKKIFPAHDTPPVRVRLSDVNRDGINIQKKHRRHPLPLSPTLRSGRPDKEKPNRVKAPYSRTSLGKASDTPNNIAPFMLYVPEVPCYMF